MSGGLRGSFLRSSLFNLLVLSVFIASLVTSLYSGDFLVVSVAGLVTYTYCVIAERFTQALLVTLFAVPFQVLATGQYLMFTLTYYPLTLILATLIKSGRTSFTLLLTLLPLFIGGLVLHPVTEVLFLHHVFVSAVVLITGYSIRVAEELIGYECSDLGIPEVEVVSFFEAGRLLNLLTLAYMFVMVFLPSLLALLAHGLTVFQSLVVSLIAGVATPTIWAVVRGHYVRLVLVLAVTTYFLLLGGAHLIDLLEEILRLVDETVRLIG